MTFTYDVAMDALNELDINVRKLANHLYNSGIIDDFSDVEGKDNAVVMFTPKETVLIVVDASKDDRFSDRSNDPQPFLVSVYQSWADYEDKKPSREQFCSWGELKNTIARWATAGR